MKLQVFSIYDRKGEIYHPPSYCHNIPDACRHFTMRFRQEETMLNLFPGDYSVWHTGEWDDRTGQHTSCKPHLVANGEGLLADESSPILFPEKPDTQANKA